MTVRRIHQKALDNNAPIIRTPTFLREQVYERQGRTDLTPRQRRRLKQKEGHMEAQDRRHL